MNMKKSVLFSLLLSLVLACWMLSAAVAVPILCRPFYYAQIDPLELPEQTGLTREEIRTAYDDVLDYCTGLREDFAAGPLWFSPSGASHFADVRGLFLLDLRVLGLSSAALLLALAACRFTALRPRRLGGRGPGFWAAAGLGGLFLVVGGLASLDFQRAFTLFHALFFPGKNNWLFNWWEDPIILLLPEAFFRNCALLILGLLLAFCAALVAADLILDRHARRSA